ncbi:hypothetical protein V6N12_044260 [Hibiscus sabdariffa]|uniref:Uncharacterized protein n=1 Tax=Hibiscus sabdariffa TaxID=183260 RepID=A0ABR2DGR9_9ROSI
MVHTVSINNGNANFVRWFTETQRLLQKKELGRHVFHKAIGKFHGHSGIARLMLFYARDDPKSAGMPRTYDLCLKASTPVSNALPGASKIAKIP